MTNLSNQYGFYHSIDTFGAADGQGIRYVLFLAGCTLGCKFCHNPDTWNQGNNKISVTDVLADVKRYRRFYEASNGGITVSGGEPLTQADFVSLLFKQCHNEGINTTIDTSGYIDNQNITDAFIHSDAVLFSIKAANPVKHKQLTGKDNTIILNNLRLAVSLSRVTIRYVVIPGINNSYDDITALANIIHGLPQPVKVELLPYHTLGRTKWERLGWKYQLDNVPAARQNEVDQVKKLLLEQNITVL